mmetsp:Transcript_20700/g.41303  ORF Transcript_20700/g.41303 Transcript_20700/m.41303 type:complete len:86 (+) Transcript_20700:563-820(+)
MFCMQSVGISCDDQILQCDACMEERYAGSQFSCRPCASVCVCLASYYVLLTEGGRERRKGKLAGKAVKTESSFRPLVPSCMLTEA